MVDRKYEILKGRLDALDYNYPFNRESIPLIEAMLSDLSSLHSTLQKLRQSRDPSLHPSYTERLDYLNREKERLENELKDQSRHDPDKESLIRIISDLRGENKLLNQKIAALQNPRPSDPSLRNSDYTEKLFQETLTLKHSLEESQDHSHRLLIENQTLFNKIQTLETQIINLKKNLELSGQTIKEVTYENRSTSEEFFGLKQVISSHESKNVLLQNEVNRLKVELQRIHQQFKINEVTLEEKRKESLELRSEVENSYNIKERTKNCMETLQRQLEVLTNENNKLHSLRDEERRSFNEVEKRASEMEAEISQNYEKIRILMKENQNFSETVRMKTDEIRTKEGQTRMIEKEAENLKVYIRKYEDCAEENQKLRENLEILSFDLKKLQQDFCETKGQLKYKDEDSRQYRAYLEQANKDIESLKKALQEESFKSESINVMKRNNDFLEDQIRLIKSQFEESLARERQLHKEVETTRHLLQKSEEKLTYSLKQSDFSSSQKVLIENENSKLQKNLSEALSRDNLKNIEIAKLENRAQALMIETEDLKIALGRSQDESCVLAQDLKDCEKMFEAEKNHVFRLSEQVSQLKNFIATLENSRNETAAKVEHLQVDSVDKDNLIKRIREEVSQVKKQLLMSEKVCADGVMNQEKLAKQIESLNFEVGRKNDELNTLKNSLRNYMNESEDLKNRIKALLEFEEAMKRNVRELEIEKSRFEEQAKSLTFSNDDNQKNLYKVQCQMNDLNKDLANVARENKRLEENIRNLEQENQNLYLKLEELTKDNRYKQEVINRLSTENDDLTSKYKASIDNVDKLTRSYDYLNLDYKKVNAKIASAENMAEHMADNMKKQEDLWARNRNDLEEELRRVIRNAEISDYKRVEAEKAFEELKRETQQQRFKVRDMDLNNEDMIRRLSSTENEKNFYETRLKSAENEIISLKNHIKQESCRVEELELMNLRKSDFEIEHRARSFQGNNDLISELYKQIEIYKTDSLKLEMDHLKLMDEHSKLKKILAQAEERIIDLESIRR